MAPGPFELGSQLLGPAPPIPTGDGIPLNTFCSIGSAVRGSASAVKPAPASSHEPGIALALPLSLPPRFATALSSEIFLFLLEVAPPESSGAGLRASGGEGGSPRRTEFSCRKEVVDCGLLATAVEDG